MGELATAGVAWVFPGQGVQGKGMGREVFDRYPDVVDQCSEMVGWNLRTQCLDNAPPSLHDTRHVQPALFLVECLTARQATDDGARLPSVLAGHSLGEYAALHVAGAFDLLDGMALVAERGACMSEASDGSMAAVIGLDATDVSRLLAEAGERDLDIANVNSHQQVVVSGPTDAITRFAGAVRANTGRYIPLQVSAPFHSRYMAHARDRLTVALRRCPMQPPRLPVLSNVTTDVHAPDDMRELLGRQLTSPVEWRGCLHHLRRRGVTGVVEMGPGTTLTRLWEQELAYLDEQPEALSALARPPSAPNGGPATTGRTAVLPASSAALPTTVLPIRESAALDAVLPRSGLSPSGNGDSLGSSSFREDYGVDLACMAGSMYRAIASVDLVARMGAAGMMGFFGTGGLDPEEVDHGIAELTRRLGRGGRFGVNLINQPGRLNNERAVIDSALAHGVRFAEVSSYTSVTPEVVRFRFSKAESATPRHIVVKLSRPEVAREFLRPARSELLTALTERGDLTPTEAAIARNMPVAGDVCVESDSGGHTDGANPLVVLPAVIRLRDRLGATTRVGASGGVGSPESIAALFRLGADFVVTGSINQCTVEAGTSDTVKDLLNELEITDTTYAPAGDMLELGARVQVVRRRTLFAARANRLMQLARWHDSLDALSTELRTDLEQRILKHTFEEIWHLVEQRNGAAEVASATARERMLFTFRWYFAWTTELALQGDPTQLVNYQVHCGPAMGLANTVLADTPLHPWRARHVDDVNRFLMEQATDLVRRPAARSQPKALR